MSPVQQQHTLCHGTSCKSHVPLGTLFCTTCWVDVPAAARRPLEQAQTAMGRNPASRKIRLAFVDALRTAARHTR